MEVAAPLHAIRLLPQLPHTFYPHYSPTLQKSGDLLSFYLSDTGDRNRWDVRADFIYF